VGDKADGVACALTSSGWCAAGCAAGSVLFSSTGSKALLYSKHHHRPQHVPRVGCHDGEVSYQAPDLVAAVALVQQHSVGVQNKVYTPNALADRMMAGVRSVAKLLGCHTSSFTGDDRRSDKEAAIAKMQAMLPAHRVH
jgi:hypothetical protein